MLKLLKGKKIFEILNRKPSSYIDIILAREEGRIEDIHEASIGRVYQHWKSSGEKGFMIITSWRAGYAKKKNIELFKKLQQEIRSNGLGFIKLEGHWVECQDTTVPYDQCPPTELVKPAILFLSYSSFGNAVVIMLYIAIANARFKNIWEGIIASTKLIP